MRQILLFTVISFSSIAQAGITWHLPHFPHPKPPSAPGAPAHGSGPSDYTYTDAVEFMHDLAAKYPQNVQLFNLGIGDTGDMIEGLKIGNGPINNLLVSTHHGNEYGATEVGKAFAASIAADPIKGQTLWVIPVLNIDGYNHREREETAQGSSWDPNRDYPGPCGTDGPYHLKDTHLLADFIAAKNIVGSATLHTYTPAVVYPWGISTQDVGTPYTDQFKTLVQAATVESQYATGNSTEVIYPADGCYEDYAFWKHGIWSILFELGYSHTPTDAEVAELNRVNVPGLRRMYEQMPLQRAENHDFTGKCDTRLAHKLDRHDE